MIAIEHFPTAQDNNEALVGRITLTPNRSMTWLAAKFFLLTLFCISFSIAVSFLYFGYWVILPFSVLEMSALAACFFFINRRTHRQEVIAMSPATVIVERGQHRPDRRIEWQRFFTKIEVTRGEHLQGRYRIVLRHKQEHEEIGTFLNEGDKRELVDALQELVRRADQPHLY